MIESSVDTPPQLPGQADDAPGAPSWVAPGPVEHPTPQLAPAPPPRKSGTAFFAVVLALFAVPGSMAQAANPVLGLAWSEAFALLLPAVVVAAASNLDPRRALLLARRPGLSSLVLAVLVGAAGFFTAGALMAATSVVLPVRWLELFDVTRIFDRPPLERAALAVIATTVAPFCEEAAFRGWVLTALRTRHRTAVAIALSALFFALMHLDPVRFPALLGLGLLYGWLAWRSGSLWPSILAHAVNNALGVTLALAGARQAAFEAAQPSPAQVLTFAALALVVSGGILRAVAGVYRRATPSPPAVEEVVVRKDPHRSRTSFDLTRIPRALLFLAVIGAGALAALAWTGPVGRR